MKIISGIYLVFILSLIPHKICCKQMVEKGTNCKYSCGNYVELFEENITLSVIDKYHIKSQFSYVDDSIPLYILSREKYWHVIEHNYGPKAKSIGRKFMNPGINEAKQWVDHGKCKIGKICAPNSDCWGSSSDLCYSDTLTDWVNEKSFNYLNMWWTTALRETCTMDWECKIIQKKIPIHYNSEGEMFVVLDEDKVKLESDPNGILIQRKSYNAFIPKIPKENSITVTLSCFKHLKSLLCEGINEEMIKFDQGTRCTVLGPSKYCLIEGEFNRVRDFGSNKYASISDLNQVRDAFVVNQERDNYNNYVISIKIKRIQKILLNVISSLTDKNPQILNGILKGNYFSRHLTDWVYEVCTCENAPSCNQKEFHSNNVRFCGKNVNAQRIPLFDINKTIDFSVDDVFKFQGKETHIIDSILEEEERGSQFYEENVGKSFWSGLIKSIDPFSWFNSVISYISLIIAILAYLKR